MANFQTILTTENNSSKPNYPLIKIQKIIDKIQREDRELYDNPAPARINRLIYAQIFPINKEYSPLIKAMLKTYISGLDKTRIKRAGEYLKEVDGAPVNVLLGTPMYMPPEMHYNKSELTRQRDLDHTVEPLVATNHPLVCKLEDENLSLNDLISRVYLKYMYNSAQLHNCRHLIKCKIMLGEQIDETTMEHLNQIDEELYELYMITNYGGRLKKRKSRKMVRKTKSKLNRKKSKYVKKY